MITIFSTNSRITNKFFKESEALGGGNPTLEQAIQQISLVGSEAITQEPVSTTEVIQRINVERIAVQPDILPEAERKQGGIKFLKRSGILLSCLVALGLQGSSCQEQLFGKPEPTKQEQATPSLDNSWAQPNFQPNTQSSQVLTTYSPPSSLDCRNGIAVRDFQLGTANSGNETMRNALVQPSIGESGYSIAPGTCGTATKKTAIEVGTTLTNLK